MIYLDPPFNSNKNYSAPIGSKAAGAAFKDTWTLDDVDEAWLGEIADREPRLWKVIEAASVHSAGMKSYLIMMAVRMLELKRVLMPTGSLYLHCNQFASHYLKMLMDAVFGEQNFITEIVWNYGTPSGGRSSGKKPVKVHDHLLVYARQYGKHLYNRQYTAYSEKYVKDWFRHKDSGGRMYRTRSRKGVIHRQYLDESPGMPLSTVWSDIMQLSSRRGWFPATNREETGYPTQKPLVLLDRIIKASSNEGDTVLDPFCGCATALVAAETLGREWAGIDLSSLAVKLVEKRLRDQLGVFGQVIARTDIPKRTDLGDLPNYRTHRHTLYGRQEGVCNGCLMHFPFRNLTVDHIVPQSKSGSDHIDNLQLLCGACNSKKGNRSMEELISGLLADGIRTK